MTNKYEERLGTERMLPLVFKMALPAVAAQFVNLLYSIVDRIYIGHIPGIGTDALAGVGVTISLVVLISSFSAIVGGRCSVGCHCPRTGQPSPCRKDTWQWLYSVDSFHFAYFVHSLYLYGAYPAFYGCFGAYAGLGGGLSFHLSVGDAVCGSVYRTECFHSCTGAPCGCHVFGVGRGFVEYYS